MKRTFILLALLALSGPAMAQSRDVPGDERAGTAGAQFLLVPTTARTASLGNSLTGGLNSLSGVEALQSNPAALSTAQGAEALFSYMDYAANADIGVSYFGVGQNFGANNIAVTVTSWDYGDIPLTTAEISDPTGLTYSAGATVVGATYAREFTDRISAGVTVKGISENLDDVSGTAVAFDAGMTYNVGESGLRFGVSLRNFGSKMSYGGNGLSQSLPLDQNDPTAGNFPTRLDADSYELPSMLNFGATYNRQFAGDVSVTALGNFRSNAYDQPEFAGGLEVGYGGLIYARAGVNIVPDQDVTDAELWSVGAGVRVPISNSALMVDYGYRQMELLGDINMITASFGF